MIDLFVECSFYQEFKILSFNVWNLNDPWNERLDMVARQISSSGADIVGLQEVRYKWEKDYGRQAKVCVKFHFRHFSVELCELAAINSSMDFVIQSLCCRILEVPSYFEVEV